MTELDETFYQLPAIMAMPHRPQSEEDLFRWAREVHAAIYDNYIPQTDRIENMVMVGETLEERPNAIGSRRYFYHRPNRILYLDVRYEGENFWDIVFSQDAAIVQLMTDNFNKILGPLDSDLQHAMDTLDDHVHASAEITLDTTSFDGVLSSLDDEVQHALDTLDDIDEIFLKQDGSTPLTSEWDAGAFAITALSLIGGDYSGGNYCVLDENGLYLFGDAIAWDDLRSPASALAPGATSPTWGTLRNGLNTWIFAANLDQEIEGAVQLPHDYAEGTDLKLHIHWIPMNTDTGNVVWEYEYTVASIGSAFPATTANTGHG